MYRGLSVLNIITINNYFTDRDGFGGVPRRRERKQKYLSRKMDDHHRLLIPNLEDNHWSTSSGKYGKDRMPALVTGRRSQCATPTLTG